MFYWLGVMVVTILLLVIIGQLHGLKKVLTTVHGQRSSLENREMAMEAWLMELESKGAELMQRIENEKNALTSLALRAATATIPPAGPVPFVAHTITPPEPIVQEWVRPAPSDGKRRNDHGRCALRQRVGIMAQNGVSAHTIARTLGLGREEVQLMLRLGEADAKKVPEWLK